MKSNLLKHAYAIILITAVLYTPASFAGNIISPLDQYTAYPITINSVTAIRNRDKTVTVNWIVDHEIGTRQYELERSTDGKTFTTVEVITTTTNDGERAMYDQIDWNALDEGTYYRIMAKSLTGKIHYSAIVKVAVLVETTPVLVYPNPVENKEVHVHFTHQPKGTYKIFMVNKLGQSIWNTTTEVDSHNDVRTYRMGHLPAGAYQVMILSAENKKTMQQVILK
ncbi:MAG: T9SS type A sorting domain-containing protein [Ferruginibacter sp.]